MRQISHWRCDVHPDNQKKLITAGRPVPPVCDWQTPDTDSWPCRRPMTLVAAPEPTPA
jgi:hypothetical protein